MGLPHSHVILNSKDRKRLLASLNESFGIPALPEGVYIQNAKDKVSLVTRDLERIDFEALVIDSLGLYLGTWQADGFRPSIEGAQLFAPMATKGILDVDDAMRAAWLKGEEIPWTREETGFLLLRHGPTGDILGCGKVRETQGKDRVILNYIPKARRLIVVNE
jgi:NOL1/NOP2/fmu family ribosome biogenesis protein